jgi:hypothetical protein
MDRGGGQAKVKGERFKAETLSLTKIRKRLGGKDERIEN